MESFKFFACRASIELARKVARLLGTNLAKLHLSNFADGEIRVWVEEEVKGKKCVVFQTTRIDPNNRLMELCLVVSALKMAGAKSVLAVIPSLGYARQFKPYQPGEANAALLMAKLLEKSGVDKALFVNLHSEKILNFFKIPATNLKADNLFANEIKRLRLEKLVLVAPDTGSIDEVANLARKLRVPAVGMRKMRKTKGFGKEDWSRTFAFSGRVKGMEAVIIDDEISSGGTVMNAAKLLKKKGAKKIYVLVTHPVFSKRTYENLAQVPLAKVVVTDTIPLEEQAFKKLSNLKVISVANLLAGEIKNRLQ
jgi:ribose-phosphate pyrophosphokinase